MSGRRRSCSWAMPGKGEGGDTEQKRWVVEGEHRGNAKGQVTYPVPNHEATEGAQSVLAPPSLVS